MSNVIKFPTSEKTASTLLARLESQAEVLEELYVGLEGLHGELHDAELKADNLEKIYNVMISDYAVLIGAENVPPELLQYCSIAKVSINAEELQYSLELDGEEGVGTQYSFKLLGEGEETGDMQYSFEFLGEDDED